MLRRGRQLEAITLCWNVIGVIVLAAAATAARSVALAGFGLDSVVEIAASAVVLWELADGDGGRQERALRGIRVAFALLAVYVRAQSAIVLASGHHAGHPLAALVLVAYAVRETLPTAG